jgi:hypothetical protein
MAQVPCDANTVQEVLANILNPNNNIRTQAEQILKQFLNKPYRGQFWPVLVQLLRSSAIPQVRHSILSCAHQQYCNHFSVIDSSGSFMVRCVDAQEIAGR